MTYKIPKNKILLEQEQKNMVLSASDREVVRIQKALGFVADYADAGEKYNDSPEDAYSALYQIYREFQLNKDEVGAEIPEGTMFPEENRSQEQFREELEKLWRVMELHSLLKEPEQEKEPEFADTYRKYQADSKRYDDMLREKEAERINEPLQDLNDNRTFMPIDKESPYYEAVSNTVYMELQDSWTELKKRPSAGAAERNMEQLLSAMQLHYLRRSATGSMLPMTQAEYEDIRGLYDRCVTDLNRFPNKEKTKPEYKTLHSLLVRNQKELNSLSPDKALPPLGDVLHGAKDPVIHLQDTENHTVGAQMSHRETVEYIDENGKLRQGFFTPEKKLGNWRKDAAELLDRYIKKYPQYETYFEKIKNDKSIYDRIENAAANDENSRRKIEVNQVLDSFQWVSQKDKDWYGDFRRVFNELGKDITKPRGNYLTLKSIGIHDGDRLADRSSAMSDVAEALGFPDLLVKSRRVTVKKGDKEIPGIMMDEAGPDTLDTDNLLKLPKGHPFFNLAVSEFNNKELLSSLADLQILDYLCANTDRHASNFFLKMDFSDPDLPKIRGVQGIDNDNSFGAIKEGPVYRLPSTENLKVITGKMAEAVKNMTPEKLEEILQPYNFRKDQIRAAQTRLKTLQGMINEFEKKGEFKISFGGKLMNKKGTIFVAGNDDDWSRLNMDALIPPVRNQRIATNIFYMADTSREELKEYQERQREREELRKKLKREPEDKVNPVLNDKTLKKPIQYDAHGFKEVDHKELEKMEAYRAEECEILRNARSLFDQHGGQDWEHRTREYKTMSRALNDYIRAYEELGKVLRGEAEEKKAIIDADEKKQPEKQQKNPEEMLKARYEALEKARKDLDQSITNYDKKKHILFLKGDSEERLIIARKLQKTIRKKPESVKAYESAVKLQGQQKETMAGKSDSQLAAYLSEQIGSKMKLALKNNIKQLREDDPVHVQGVKALQAHENLWNYSQSVISEGMLSVKNMDVKGTKDKEKVKKQKTSIKLMEYELRKKLTEKPDKKKIYEDMAAIREYVGTLVKKEKSKMQAYDEEIRKTQEKLKDETVEQAKITRHEQAKLEKKKEEAGERLKQNWELYGQIDDLMPPKNKKTAAMREQIKDFLPEEKQAIEEKPAKKEKQEKKAELTPRQIRDMLNKVYRNELSIADQYQPEKKQEISKKK